MMFPLIREAEKRGHGWSSFEAEACTSPMRVRLCLPNGRTAQEVGRPLLVLYSVLDRYGLHSRPATRAASVMSSGRPSSSSRDHDFKLLKQGKPRMAFKLSITC